MPSKRELQEMQALPLSIKISLSQTRIREWVRHFGIDGVYIAFSGGKDSRVLLDIVRKMYGNDIPGVFANTGLEFPEIQSFIKTFDNIEIIRPALRFDEVIRKYGYPLVSKQTADMIEGARRGISKGEYNIRLAMLGVNATDYNLIDSGKYEKTVHNSKFVKTKYRNMLELPIRISAKCCYFTKKQPFYLYEKETKRVGMTGQQASESVQREATWIKNGCNAFDAKKPISNPLSFWTEQDILQYIKENNLSLAKVYGDVVYTDGLNEYDNSFFNDCTLKTTGCTRTGCVYCAFGLNLEKGKTRFQRLKETHPKQYDYCINGGHWVTENGKELWQPNKDGLGMGKVFDMCNEIYGEDFFRYK